MKRKFFQLKYHDRKWKEYWFFDISTDWCTKYQHNLMELYDFIHRTYNEPVLIDVLDPKAKPFKAKPLKKVEGGQTADYFSHPVTLPIVSKRFGEFIQDYAPNDIERIPVLIQGSNYKVGDFEVLKVYHLVDCIDMENSIIKYNNDPQHPTRKVGEPMHFSKVKLDVSKIDDSHIFKIPFNHAIYVSEELKKAIEEQGFTGTKFLRV